MYINNEKKQLIWVISYIFAATEMLSQQAVTKVGKHIILFAVIEADYLVFWIKM